MDAEFFAKARARQAEIKRRDKVLALARGCSNKLELDQKLRKAGLGSRSDDCSALLRQGEEYRVLTGWKRIHRMRQMKKRMVEEGL